MAARLDVYLHDMLAGSLTRIEGKLSFTYDSAYCAQQSPQELSIALPVRTEPFSHKETFPFFSGLLPDDGVRARLAKHLNLSEGNTFALLEVIGGECAGAVSVHPVGTGPNTRSADEFKVFCEDGAFDVLSRLRHQPFLAGEEGIRISGAGAQDKLAVAFCKNQLAIPEKNTPSTHIIKPAITDLEDSVHNEFFCMRLAKKMGLDVPQVDIYWVKEEPFYLIERYDRQITTLGHVERLHQEDFCQALHIPPNQKYQNDAGPSLKNCFALLDAQMAEGRMPGVDKMMFLRAVIFNFLVGNGDAHGKNFSLLSLGKSTRLTPFYDLLSTHVYENPFTGTMAMKLGSKYKFNAVRRRHLLQMGMEAGLKESFVEKHIENMCLNILEKSQQLATELNAHAATKSPIYENIIAVIKRHIAQLKRAD